MALAAGTSIRCATPDPEAVPFDPTAFLLPTSGSGAQRVTRASFPSPPPAGTADVQSPAHPRTTPDGEPLYLPPPDCRDRPEHAAGYTPAALQRTFFDRWEPIVHDHYYFDDRQGTLFLERYLADPANRLTGDAALTEAPPPVPRLIGRARSGVVATAELLAELEAWMARLEARIAACEPLLASHLWIPRDFADPARRDLEAARTVAKALHTRLEAIHDGFVRLARQAAQAGLEEG
jgi:hypothetical protein